MHTESLGPNSEAWLLMGAELGEMERQLDGSQVATALYVPQLRMVDLPALQASLVGKVEQGGGVWGNGKVVKGVKRAEDESGWVVGTSPSGTKAEEAGEEEILATHLILADPQSLLSSTFDPLLPNPAGPSSSSAGRTPRYFAYNGPGMEGVEKLMYPCPAEGMGSKELGGPNLVHIGEDGKVVFEVWGDLTVEDVAQRVRDYVSPLLFSFAFLASQFSHVVGGSMKNRKTDPFAPLSCPVPPPSSRTRSPRLSPSSRHHHTNRSPLPFTLPLLKYPTPSPPIRTSSPFTASPFPHAPQSPAHSRSARASLASSPIKTQPEAQLRPPTMERRIWKGGNGGTSTGLLRVSRPGQSLGGRSGS